MAQWMVWSILAAAVVILELFSGTFYLLMIAIGLAGGAAVAFAGGTLEIQLIVAAVVGLLATAVLRRSRFGKPGKRGSAGNSNMNLDIGQAILIDHWTLQGINGGPPTARVMYRGALWDVELMNAVGDNPAPLPGRFLIRDVQGSRLIVSTGNTQ